MYISKYLRDSQKRYKCINEYVPIYRKKTNVITLVYWKW